MYYPFVLCNAEHVLTVNEGNLRNVVVAVVVSVATLVRFLHHPSSVVVESVVTHFGFVGADCAISVCALKERSHASGVGWADAHEFA